MKNKKTIVVKHIHSSFTSTGINDVLLYAIISAKNVDFIAKANKSVASKKNKFINNEKVHKILEDKLITVIYLKSDKTFYNRGVLEGNLTICNSYHETQDFRDLIKYYIEKGFNLTQRPEELDKFYKRKKQQRKDELKADGHVLWMGLDEIEYKDYQGGFSNDLFNDRELKNYINTVGSFIGVYGWIGHLVRTVTLDKAIEEGLIKRGLSCSKMINWIVSTDGMHFGNSLEGLTETQQLKRIDNYLNTIFNLCLIYGERYLKGSLYSKEEIKSELKEKGWLLPE